MFASLSFGLALLPLTFAAIHDVQVGSANGTDLVFTPEALSADIGDQVVFHFNPKNHSVQQSTFANPCGQKEGGFNSGFNPVALNTSSDSLPTFTYTVTTNSSTPIWVYCGQGANTAASHCGKGMIFAINCPPTGSANSLDNFKAAALAIGASLAASASAASAAATQTGGSPTLTAAYGGITIPAVVSETLVTVPITFGSSTWTTTYTSYEGSPNPTPAAVAGAVHTVTVGGLNANGTTKLFFDPDHIIAAPRDQITFQFLQKNHSVVQSSFADPCRPLNANNASAPQALSSGFQPVATNATDFPTWTITVNNTQPTWFYCAQTNPTSHCGAGMVFSVNAIDNTSRSFAAFQSIAEQLNGTVAGNLAAPSATSTTGGALSIRAGSAGFVVALIAITASLL